MKQNKTIFILGAAAFVIASYFALGEVFRLFDGKSAIVMEIYAAVLASVITVASMAVMMNFQSDQDKERDFSCIVFEKKLSCYQEILNDIFASDDDNIIEEKEIQDLENKIGSACLIADKYTVAVFSQFVFQLKVYGVVYFRSMTSIQKTDFCEVIRQEKEKSISQSLLCERKHALQSNPDGNERDYFVTLDQVIQAMRDDLNVVEGDIAENVEHFVLTPFDGRKMIKDPNRVD
jgi:hypothetical protein